MGVIAVSPGTAVMDAMVVILVMVVMVVILGTAAMAETRAETLGETWAETLGETWVETQAESRGQVATLETLITGTAAQKVETRTSEATHGIQHTGD